jgi:hypothetical protein
MKHCVRMLEFANVDISYSVNQIFMTFLFLTKCSGPFLSKSQRLFLILRNAEYLTPIEI